MRHTEVEITVKGITHHPHRFVVPIRLGRRLDTMLRHEIEAANDDEDRIPAEEVFPEAFDPVKGPALALRGLRYREEMTQKELAKKLGIRQHHLSEMEHAKRPIGKAMAKKIAAVLNANWRVLM